MHTYTIAIMDLNGQKWEGCLDLDSDELLDYMLTDGTYGSDYNRAVLVHHPLAYSGDLDDDLESPKLKVTSVLKDGQEIAFTDWG